MSCLHRSLCASLILIAATALGADSKRERAFPGAVGFGAFTPGGRGGEIVRVTTLKREGAGSFAEALRAKGPRIIVFEVGGVIDLAGRTLKISEPYVTIVGATAPAPGITLIRGGLQITTHDVVMQHISIRPGQAGRAEKSGWETDGLSTVSGSNVIVDHCSFTWATDENLSASGPRFRGESVEEWRKGTSHRITFSNCIIAECLSQSTHRKGEHSKGTLLHDNATELSVIGNLYASNTERNPLAKGGVQAVIANNWISNPGRRAIHHAFNALEWKGHSFVTSRLSVVGNLLEHGANTPAKLPVFYNHSRSPVELFLKDNLGFDPERNPVDELGPEQIPLKSEASPWPEGFKPMPASKVKEYVAKNAGARPWDRDPIDARIVQAALEGKGKIINSEEEVGGYPQRKETRATFNPDEWDLATMQRRK